MSIPIFALTNSNGNINGNCFGFTISMAMSIPIFFKLLAMAISIAIVVAIQYQWQYQYQFFPSQYQCQWQYQLFQLSWSNINGQSINCYWSLSIQIAMSIVPMGHYQLSMAISIPQKCQYQWFVNTIAHVWYMGSFFSGWLIDW